MLYVEGGRHLKTVRHDGPPASCRTETPDLSVILLPTSCVVIIYLVVCRSIEDGASVNATCRQSGTTALQLAVILGHLSVAEYLVAAHADIRRQDLKGRQAVHFAAANSKPALLNLLLDAVRDDPAVVNSRVAVVQDKEPSLDDLDLDSWDHNHDILTNKVKLHSIDA